MTSTLKYFFIKGKSFCFVLSAKTDNQGISKAMAKNVNTKK